MIGEEERAAVMRVLEGPILVHGPVAQEFEENFAEFCGAPFAISVASCTAGMHLVYFAMGYGVGDEILVPAQTHVATAHAVELTGAKPVFVDACLPSGNVDLTEVEKAITPKTKCIIVVHLYGQPVSSEIFEFAQEHKIPVIEDAAQGHGASLNGKSIGSFGDIATFSFFPSKNMAVGGDGGAIITTREDLIGEISKFIDHGRLSKYINDSLGTNFRLSEIQCGIGRVQLKQLDSWVERRNEIAAKYHESFEALSWAAEPKIRNGALHAWHQYVMRTEDREGFITHMDDSGISTGIHYPIPCHLQPVYAAHPQASDPALTLTEIISDQVVSIPVFPLLEDAEVDRIVEAVRAWRT